MKKHYYLASGEVFFRTPVDEAGEQSIGSVKLNAMITTNNGKIIAKDLGKTQQALQLRFHDRMKDPTLEVFDVFLIGFSYLGHMTDEQFSQDRNLNPISTADEDAPKEPNALDILAGLPGSKGVFDA